MIKIKKNVSCNDKLHLVEQFSLEGTFPFSTQPINELLMCGYAKLPTADGRVMCVPIRNIVEIASRGFQEG